MPLSLLQFTLAVAGVSLLACAFPSLILVEAQPAPPVWFSACPVSTDSSFLSAVLARPFSASTVPDAAPWLKIVPGYDPTCPAAGFFQDEVASTGWGTLQVVGSAGSGAENDADGKLETRKPSSTADADVGASGQQWSFVLQSEAMGFLEGSLTAQRIWQAARNRFGWHWPKSNGTVPSAVTQFIARQNAWVSDQVNSQPADDPYWRRVAGSYAQVQGLWDGYATVADPSWGTPLQASDILLLNHLPESDDEAASTDPDARKELDVLNMHDLREVKHVMTLHSHCSALVRIIEGGMDLAAAHASWISYASMLRIYKTYTFAPTPSLKFAMSTTQFSSSPGLISSMDDYYQLDSGLIVIETTNNVANVSLYDFVSHQSVPTFVRAVVANALSADGATWASTFSEHNSGTYCNQWMVVDTKLFTPGQALAPNTLWIASQIPGQVMTRDVTDVLIQQGYWASYNIPYFPELWQTLGYGALVQKFGVNGTILWDYHKSFRATQFARDAPNIHDVDGVRQIMQQNNWQTDPLSYGSAELAIASRTDLSYSPLDVQSPFGAVDAKISTASLMSDPREHLLVYAKSGPTTENQPPFVWSTSQWSDVLHLGMPDEFDFDWQTFSVTALPARGTDSSTAVPRILLTEQ